MVPKEFKTNKQEYPKQDNLNFTAQKMQQNIINPQSSKYSKDSIFCMKTTATLLTLRIKTS